MIKMKWIMSSTLAGLLLVTMGSFALAEEEDEKDLSAYQWGYWDKMVSPAAGPLAPVGDIASAPLPPPPVPEPTPIPEPPPIPEPEPEPVPPPVIPARPELVQPEHGGLPGRPGSSSLPAHF